MRLYKYLVLLLLYSTIVSSTTQHSSESVDPLLVIVLMVKNEEPFMIPTLKPYVDAGITSFLIFDTGSTDKTIAVTRKYFDDNGIKQGYIFQEPFVDFSISRNRALVLAEEKFPRAGFFLMPDAEWYFENVQGLILFCREEIKKTGPDAPHSYLVKLVSNTIDFFQQRLICNGHKLRFAGVVHETISIGTVHRVPTTSYFKLSVSRQGITKSRKRWARDKELLLKEHQRNPHNARTVFYLAQTYFCLGELENAHKYYQLRTTLAGYDQEIGEAYYKLGTTTLMLMKDSAAQYTWEMAFNYFLKSYELRPWRAEPLIAIGRYYIEHNQSALAYLYLRRAIEIPYPDKEVLFVEKMPYFYGRYDLLARSAWSSNACELGEWAVKRALEFAPHLPHLHLLLKGYLDMKNQAEGA